jgi:hypothetical protein
MEVKNDETLYKIDGLFCHGLSGCQYCRSGRLGRCLVGYWPLDGNADDPIGGTTGELMDGAEWSDDGHLGGAVMLDGVTGHVVISGFELITDSITFVCWLKAGDRLSGLES